MDRYDWEWRRGRRGPSASWYDRDRNYEAQWPGRYRGAPGGGYGYGPGGWGGYGGYSRDDQGYAGGPPERGGGYRYSYGGPGWGGRRRYGRQEPWEPGPPGGYGSQWGTAYGGRYDRYSPEPGPFARGGAFDPFAREAFADLPDAPRGYYDDYQTSEDDEAFADDLEVLRRQWAEDEPDDSDVRESVARSLHDDGFIDADAIQLEVKDRVVTLRGEVKDYMEARYAWDDAWDARGVRGVISKLTVQGVGRQEAPADAARKEARG